MELTQVLKGLATRVPGASYLRRRSTGGTNSARYCYSVWLRHLVHAHEHSLETRPKVVAELGPGDSIGMGVAALISGCEKYYAFDVVEYADIGKNLAIFDELVQLFEKRESIPSGDEFANLKPGLDSFDFPAQILTQERMQAALDGPRIEQIRESIRRPNVEGSLIHYRVPWYDAGVLDEETADMIFSQAVLEHVDDLPNTYQAMCRWLKPDGYVTHQIDFKSHGITPQWNGHWRYSDFMWKIIRGKRTYLLNREPYSTHVKMFDENGFEIVCEKKVERDSELSLDDLAARYSHFTNEDLTTSGVFFVAVKAKTS